MLALSCPLKSELVREGGRREGMEGREKLDKGMLTGRDSSVGNQNL